MSTLLSPSQWARGIPARVSHLWHFPEPRLRDTSLFLLLLLAAMLMLATVDDRLFNGFNVWDKPSRFALSFAVQLATLALLWRALPRTAQTGWAASAIVRTLILISLLEVGYIAGRAAAGLPSHFAYESTFASVAYSLMGVGATTFVLLVAWLGIRTLTDQGYRDPLRLSIGLGLILSGVLGLISGFMLVKNNGSLIGAPGPDSAVWPLFGWSREVGDLRPAHFLGQHAMQLLPLLGLLAMSWRPAQARLVVWLGAAALLSGTIALIAMARAGMPL